MRLPIVLQAGALMAALGATTLWGQNLAFNSFLVTNDDVAGLNSVTFYALNADGTLGNKHVFQTSGVGIGGGFFAAKRIAVVPNGTEVCVFLSDAGSGDIAGVDARTHSVVGNFPGSATDSGTSNGIGLAANANYLYAAYSTSSTIATFQIQAGCKLNFVSDVLAVGLNFGYVGGMAIRGSTMVVSYGDGSIESFNISAGTPVSNGDAQVSTGFTNDHVPNGVIITQDGHYAIFGDASTVTTAEVSDISSGKLTTTLPFHLGSGWNSGSVRLSPDETVLYISNSSSGQVAAAFFDKTTGTLREGCTSAPLKNFYTNWVYAGGVTLQLTTGTGGIVYVPEFGSGSPSAIGMLQYTASGGTCTLTETAASPTLDPNHFSELLSIEVYPTP